MYAVVVPNLLNLLLMGVALSGIFYPVNRKIVGMYNRKISRELLREELK